MILVKFNKSLLLNDAAATESTNEMRRWTATNCSVTEAQVEKKYNEQSDVSDVSDILTAA